MIEADPLALELESIRRELGQEAAALDAIRAAQEDDSPPLGGMLRNYSPSPERKAFVLEALVRLRSLQRMARQSLDEARGERAADGKALALYSRLNSFLPLVERWLMFYSPETYHLATRAAEAIHSANAGISVVEPLSTEVDEEEPELEKARAEEAEAEPVEAEPEPVEAMPAEAMSSEAESLERGLAPDWSVPEYADEGIRAIVSELESLVGLGEAKREIRDLINYLVVRKRRLESGLKASGLTLHYVFMGNPGTGKTTVARLMGRIFRELGVSRTGQLVETDRSELVEGYVGHTAKKVREVVDRALGGILFIDEAYALTGTGNDFGQEAVNTLLKLMEDHRDDLVVIAAGYPRLMEAFIDSNPGLKSRFTRYLRFKDYSPAEMSRIYERMCAEHDYALAPGCAGRLAELLSRPRSGASGNGRYVRNLFEETVRRHSNRIVALGPGGERDDASLLSTIEASDIPSAREE